jgi:hypothetical protein
MLYKPTLKPKIFQESNRVGIVHGYGFGCRQTESCWSVMSHEESNLLNEEAKD